MDEQNQPGSRAHVPSLLVPSLGSSESSRRETDAAAWPLLSRRGYN